LGVLGVRVGVDVFVGVGVAGRVAVNVGWRVLVIPGVDSTTPAINLSKGEASAQAKVRVRMKMTKMFVR
jgi:hypothetical protein